MMLNRLILDSSTAPEHMVRPGLWLLGAAALTMGYILFGLAFQGVQGLSRGGFLFAAAAIGWCVIGVCTQQAKFPPVLLLPLAFFAYLLVSGLQLGTYPTEYALRVFTVWMGAVALAVFVSNGLAMRWVVLGLIAMVALNYVAILLGYDTNMVNTDDFDANSLQYAEISRNSGLAGQVNKLVGVLFTLPFAVFLLRRPIGLVGYLCLVAVCIAAALATGSRSTLLFSTLFLGLGGIWLLKPGPFRLLFIAGGLAGVVVATTFLTSERALSRIENSSIGELVLVQRTLKALDGEDGSSEAREEFRTSFWPYFNEQPVLGYGPEQFATVTGADVYAHNNFAELAINGGLVGLALYYAMYVAVGFGVLTSVTRNLALIAPLIFLAVADVGFVTMLARGLVLILCLALVIAFDRGRSSRRRSGRGSGRRRRRRTA